MEVVGPNFSTLENAVEEVETVVEVVAGSVWPPQVLEEIQYCHRP